MATFHDLSRFQDRPGGARLRYSQNSRQRFIDDLTQLRRHPRRLCGNSRYQKHGLADKHHLLAGQQLVVAKDWRDIVGAGNIRR
jgi:hypothetical protein